MITKQIAYVVKGTYNLALNEMSDTLTSLEARDAVTKTGTARARLVVRRFSYTSIEEKLIVAGIKCHPERTKSVLKQMRLLTRSILLFFADHQTYHTLSVSQLDAYSVNRNHFTTATTANCTGLH